MNWKSKIIGPKIALTPSYRTPVLQQNGKLKPDKSTVAISNTINNSTMNNANNVT